MWHFWEDWATGGSPVEEWDLVKDIMWQLLENIIGDLNLQLMRTEELGRKSAPCCAPCVIQ
jgi:hypothetical protein